MFGFLKEYESRLINGPDGDPGVYCLIKNTGDACLFDLGSLENLSNRELLKVRHVFVSHTHIDHFYGFERLLRVNIPHFRKIEIAGPPNIIDQVKNKLRGFTWNLLEPDQIQFVVHELRENHKVTTVLLNNNNFYQPINIENQFDNASPIVNASICAQLSDGATVCAALFDHGTPCAGYRLETKGGVRVSPEVVEELGFKPGPWISDLQYKYCNDQMSSHVKINGKEYQVEEIGKKIFTEKTSFSFGYITDIEFTRQNLDQARKLFNDVTVLLCESNFSCEDYKKAFKKKHLTAKQAAMIAHYVKAREFKTFHISSIYGQETTTIEQQGADFFNIFKNSKTKDFENELAFELALKDCKD